ncbi:MAG: glycogen debranching protein [Ruminococcus sp.]|nr:glycogen debranching protein [Ruminococcus sp.]
MRQVMGYPKPLGTEKRNATMNFATVVPAGKTCSLLLYKAGKPEPVEEFAMPEEDGIGEVRFLALEGLKANRYEYNYRIDGKIYTDPFAKSIVKADTEEKEEQIRAGFTRDEYDWEGDSTLKIPHHEVIAYSLHVRGFTKHSSSGVKHKGTFQGIIEKIDYLKDLGINQIQCMPIYEFSNIVNKKKNYWGYGTGYYFAPKASYAASKDASRELKDMVKACHKAGIEVVLEMPFDGGIRFQTALECLQYYMMEYHIDGFIVNPYVVSWGDLKNDPLLKGTKLMRKNDWFQNTIRRFLKSDSAMVPEVKEALKHQAGIYGEYNYITSHTGFTLNDLVSYNEKHNEANGEENQDGPDQNYSWNCGEEGPSRKRGVVELRNRQRRNAFLFLLAAQGTPCILAGDEFGNTQNGNNNVYCQDNETAWLDWRNLKKNKELFDYVKLLIHLRKEHFALHKDIPLTGMDKTESGIPDVSYHGEYAWQILSNAASRQLGVMYNDVREGVQDTCYLAYNAHWTAHDFALPVLQDKVWKKLIDTSEEISEEWIESKTVEVGPRSIVLLTAQKRI